MTSVVEELFARHGFASTDMQWKAQVPHDYPPIDEVREKDDGCVICLNPLHVDRDEEGNVLGRPVRVCPVKGEGGGHVMHEECYRTVLARGSNFCPTCRESMQTPRAPPTVVTDPATGAMMTLMFEGNITWHYEGEKGNERLVSTDYPRYTTYYKGKRGYECKISVYTHAPLTPTISKYVGPRGWERKVSLTFLHNNERHTFDGPYGHERLVEIKFDGGNMQYYEGPKGEEHMVRRYVASSKHTVYYDGAKGAERTLRIESPGGRRIVYFGRDSAGQDAKRVIWDEDYSTTYLEGDRGYTYRTHKVLKNGTVEHFMGGFGEDRLYKKVIPPGRIIEYTGPKGREKPIKPDAGGPSQQKHE